MEGGAAAFPGVGCGPAFLVQGDEDLLNFPDGAVLVARHSSPKFVMVMRQGPGHRHRFRQHLGPHGLPEPGILPSHPPGFQGGHPDLAPGQIVTVDAYTSRVYQGHVPELLNHQPLQESHLKDTPVYKILERVAESILPLRLVDPRSPDFAPDHCRSLHDLGRLARFSYTEMFKMQRPGLGPGRVRPETGPRPFLWTSTSSTWAGA